MTTSTDPTCPGCGIFKLYENEELCRPCLEKADQEHTYQLPELNTTPWDHAHVDYDEATGMQSTTFCDAPHQDPEPPSALPAGWTPPAELVTTVRRLAGAGSNVNPGDPDADLTALQRARRTSGAGRGVSDGSWWPRRQDGEEAPEE